MEELRSKLLRLSNPEVILCKGHVAAILQHIPLVYGALFEASRKTWEKQSRGLRWCGLTLD